MHVLLVLLWKLLLVRKRKKCLSIFSLCMPTVLFGLLYYFRESAQRVQMKDEDSFSSNSDSDDDAWLTRYRRSGSGFAVIPLEDVPPPTLVIYTPSMHWTNDLMDEIGRTLHLNRNPIFTPGIKGYFGVSHNDTNLLMSILSNNDVMDHKTAIINFHGAEQERHPTSLNYTIRMKKVLREYNRSKHTPFIVTDVDYKRFLRLQWAIDSNFLKVYTGNPVNMSLYVEELPLSDPRSYGTTYVAATYVTSMLLLISRISPILAYTILIERVAKDRITGVKELIKMAGVSDIFIEIAELLDLMPEGILFAFSGSIFATIGNQALLHKTSALLIFINLILFYLNVMFMGYVASYVSNKMQYNSLVGIMFYVLMPIPANAIGEIEDLPKAIIYLNFLLYGGPINWFWGNVGALELHNKGLTFSNMWQSHNPRGGPVGLAMIGSVLQCAIFYALARYLQNVRPGPYGTSKRWNYCLQASYWTGKLPAGDEEETEDEVVEMKDTRYFEEAAGVASGGVKVVNVTKIYNGRRVLSSISLDIFRGEITVLLGHNGAGKTTLMSIISGMISASDGKIYLDGIDVSSRGSSMRKQFSLCPQQNIVIEDLSVRENVMFFAMLKGESYVQAKSSSQKLLTDMNLAHRMQYKTTELSGGMKRRLQLACALSGGSSVVLLDEPTSGLDVENRRELWNLMLSLRGQRAVLLSTHFMEEADALGDRVAALHQGRLKCHATPMHLKTQLGTGYSLTISTAGQPKKDEITSVITSSVPTATIKHTDYNSLVYSLPLDKIDKFPELFANLEKEKEALGIDSIGLGVISLEEVFLNLCSDVSTSFTPADVDTNAPEPIYETIYGFTLHFRQFLVLIKRIILYYWSTKWVFLLTQIIIPVGAIWLFVVYFYVVEKFMAEKGENSRLDISNEEDHKRLFYSYKGDKNTGLLKLHSMHVRNMDIEVTNSVRDAIINTNNLVIVNEFAAGVEINDTSVKILYGTPSRHAAPSALNMLSNALAGSYGPTRSGRIISMHNHPLSTVKVKMPKSVGVMMMQNCIVLYLYYGVVVNAIQMAIKDRQSGTQHIHIMAGCPPLVHCLAALLSHFGLYFVTLLLPLVLSYNIDFNDTLNNVDFMLTLAVILSLGMLAMLAFQYLLAFYLNSTVIITFIVVVLGLILGIIYFLLIYNKEVYILKMLILIFVSVIPSATMTVAVLQLSAGAIRNALCNLNLENCFVLQYLKGFADCCAEGKGTYCYFCFPDDDQGYFGLGWFIVFLILQFIIYLSLIVFAQYGLVESIQNKVTSRYYKPPPKLYNDKIVQLEEYNVRMAFDCPPHVRANPENPHSMLIGDVHKRYYRYFGCLDKVYAVRGVSFSVKKGECFGLLGLNGAGKSTIFKMITAEIVPTKGMICANGRDLNWPRTEYLKALGYCPQHFGLDDFLTGSQNLSLILTLRGLCESDTHIEVNNWLDVADLVRYANIPVAHYSGGCVRRMATVAALASGARVTLLDEPTSGVDVSARRRVWLALKKGLRNNRSVIITSHSMDEMEALCGRIAILANGELACIGSSEALKAAYGVGHSVRIKTTTFMDQEKKRALNNFKEAIIKQFDCVLKDEHASVLHYRINKTMSYSTLFTMLEALKKEHSTIVEDYFVTATTLEEVFLSFAHPMMRHQNVHDPRASHH